MSSQRLGWLSAPGPAAPLPEEKIAPTYRTWRFNVFMGIFIGYAGFYLIRNNIPLVSAVLEKHDLLGAAGIGIVANAVLFSYGLSKFFHGHALRQSQCQVLTSHLA